MATGGLIVCSTGPNVEEEEVLKSEQEEEEELHHSVSQDVIYYVTWTQETLSARISIIAVARQLQQS